MHKWLLAFMSKLLSSEEMGRMIDCVCTYLLLQFSVLSNSVLICANEYSWVFHYMVTQNAFTSVI